MLPAKWSLTGYFVIGALGAFLALGVHIIAQREFVAAKQHYVDASHAQAVVAARQIDASLKSIYENLRTLSYLPSVRKIDRYGKKLSEEAKETISQIYNNLASNVAVSEIYIVPVTLDPDKIDPATGKAEAPILMFDNLIAHTPAQIGPGMSESNDLRGGVAEEEPEEVEIFEYRAIRDQFTWLTEHFPDTSKFHGLDVPVIGGPSVITCDNTKFRNTRADADRTGVTFSVPFYDESGKLKGGVTAIVLDSALRALLPPRSFSLINSGYGYHSPTNIDDQEQAASAWIERGEPDPDLIYSEVIPLSLKDPKSPWSLWVGFPDAAFIFGAEARSIRLSELSGYFTVFLMTFAGAIGWLLLQRSHALDLATAASQSLEQRVAQRTEEINFLATHDALTGLPNRVHLGEDLQRTLPHIKGGELTAVHMLDLDNFKMVNDTLGHSVGDKLLERVAARMRLTMRETDLIARMGGDEFTIIQRNISGPGDAAALARRVIEAVSEPCVIGDHQVVVGASIGIAIGPHDGATPEELLRNSDLALYRAKREGRGAFCFFEQEMNAKMQARGTMERELRRALANGEFELHYQPIYDLSSSEINGFEALLRWRHPDRGVVSPDEFIPLAEETRLIVPIGEWVIREACATFAKLPAGLRIAVNLSPVQFRNANLADVVVGALTASGLPASQLELEITESVLMDGSESTLSTLHRLRNLGVRIAMDDFGTGYSSLSYLQSFPFDKIKIDKSFVKGIGGDSGSLSIVRAVASLARGLGIATTAEGVESDSQLDAVRLEGCTEMQGFLMSKPLKLTELEAFLKTKSTLPPKIATGVAA